jgi:wobble nucleotide-excising tRNase
MNDIDNVELGYQAIINKLEDEKHEQREQMAILREEIKELNEAMGGLLETSDYWRDGCLKLKGLSHKLKEKNNELRKDRERLDWLLNYEGNYWLLSNREDVDKEMEDAQ